MRNSTAEKQIKLSPSTLNKFRDCPYCFWLAMVKGIKLDLPMPGIVRALDSVVKNYFQKYREQGEVPPIIRGRIDGRLVARPLSFIKFVDESLNAQLSGRLDECLVLPDGSYAPVDHKSAGSVKASVHPAFQAQMDAYALLLERNGYPVANKGYLLFYIPDNGDLHDGMPLEVNIMEVSTDPGRAYDLFRRAVDVARSPEPPESGPACPFCNWRKAI